MNDTRRHLGSHRWPGDMIKVCSGTAGWPGRRGEQHNLCPFTAQQVTFCGEMETPALWGYRLLPYTRGPPCAHHAWDTGDRRALTLTPHLPPDAGAEPPQQARLTACSVLCDCRLSVQEHPVPSGVPRRASHSRPRFLLPQAAPVAAVRSAQPSLHGAPSAALGIRAPAGSSEGPSQTNTLALVIEDWKLGQCLHFFPC